jgi:hypothetical protein
MKEILGARVPAWINYQGKQVWKQYFTYEGKPNEQCWYVETDDGSKVTTAPPLETK